MAHDEKSIVEELEKAAAKLDGIEAPTPDFTYFKALADRQQSRRKRAERVQLALFAVVAVMLVSAIILLAGLSVTYFLFLQGAVLTGTAAGLAVFSFKARKHGRSVS